MWLKTRTVVTIKTLSFGLVVALVMQLVGCGSGSGSGSAPTPDNNDPYARIIFPTPDALTDSESITVRGTAGAVGTGVASVTVNGKDATSNDGFANWTVELPLTKTGVQPLDVEVRDKAGNRSKTVAQARLRVAPPLLIGPAGQGGGGIDLSLPSAVALDDDGHAWVTTEGDGGDTLVKVRLSDGQRTEVPKQGETVILVLAEGLAIDTQGQAWVADSLGVKLVSIDLASGKRRQVSGPDSNGNVTLVPLDVALDDSDRVWVIDSIFDALVEVDRDSGEILVVSDAEHGTGDIEFSTPVSLALDKQNQAWVIDSDHDALVRVSLGSGDRTLISGAGKGGGDEFITPSSIALDDQGQAWVMDRGKGLFRVDLESGERELVSHNALPNGGPSFVLPNDVALDVEQQLAWVVDLDMQALYAIDMTTGQRVIVSK